MQQDRHLSMYGSTKNSIWYQCRNNKQSLSVHKMCMEIDMHYKNCSGCSQCILLGIALSKLIHSALGRILIYKFCILLHQHNLHKEFYKVHMPGLKAIRNIRMGIPKGINMFENGRNTHFQMGMKDTPSDLNNFSMVINKAHINLTQYFHSMGQDIPHNMNYYTKNLSHIQCKNLL